jgi:hypothetical protein
LEGHRSWVQRGSCQQQPPPGLLVATPSTLAALANDCQPHHNNSRLPLRQEGGAQPLFHPQQQLEAKAGPVSNAARREERSSAFPPQQQLEAGPGSCPLSRGGARGKARVNQDRQLQAAPLNILFSPRPEAPWIFSWQNPNLGHCPDRCSNQSARKNSPASPPRLAMSKRPALVDLSTNLVARQGPAGERCN